MNYEVVSGSPETGLVKAPSMTPGQMGYVVGGPHNGHLVWMSPLNNTLFSLSDDKYYWSECRGGGSGDTMRVRLLRPGEEVHLRGK